MGLNDTKTYTMDQLEEKYYRFLTPTFEIVVDGESLTSSFLAISKLTVETTTESKSDSCVFTVTNAFDLVKRDFLNIQKLVAGKPLTVKMGYTDRLETVFIGFITSVKYQFPSGSNPVVVVTGMDLSFFMKRKKQITTWKNKTYSDIANALAGKYKAKKEIDPTDEVFPRIPQNKLTDYELLETIAQRCNREFFVVGDTLYFREPLKEVTPMLTLTWGKNLMNLNVDVNISKQVSEVVVSGMDYQQVKVIEAKAVNPKFAGKKKRVGKDFLTVYDTVTEQVEANVLSLNEAQLIADSILQKRSMNLVTGTGECIGIPELRAGRYIEIEGVGKELSQVYYLTSVTHTITNTNGYITSFQVGGNTI